MPPPQKFFISRGERGVSTVSWEAATIASKILGYGGSAVDAFIAAQIGLEIFEPGWTGLGGGGFALIYMPETGEREFIDFREVLPKNHRLYEASEEERRYGWGPYLVGVPGLPAGLETLAYGLRYTSLESKMDRRELLDKVMSLTKKLLHPPSRLLIESFKIYPRDWEKILIYSPRYGAEIEEAVKLRRPLDIRSYIKTLEKLTYDGWSSFYSGPLSKTLLKSFEDRDVPISADDLQSYKVVWRRPVEFTIDGVDYISTPPPGSGKALEKLIAILIEKWDEPEEYLEGLREAHLYRDRIQDPGTSFGETVHISIYDGEYLLLSTTTLECFMGSGVYIDELGIMLNDELHDFDIGKGYNEPLPGRRPRSSMSPTVALKPDGSIVGLGSSGGTRIVTAISTTLYQHIYRGLRLEEAVDYPRLHYEIRREAYLYEPDERITRYIEALKRKGYTSVDAVERYRSPFRMDRSIQMGDVEAIELRGRCIKLVSDYRKGLGASAVG